ncbi:MULTISPECIES: hypothetical protein [unclassified Pseudoalteromonas]|nr:MULTISPECIES: hypothetical protein [unclassified Pseudoalteromonas]
MTLITTKKCVVLAGKIDQLFIGVGIKPRPDEMGREEGLNN